MTQVRASTIRPLLICAAVMEAAFLLIHAAREPAEQVALVLASYLVSGVAFGWLLWRLAKTSEGGSSRAMIVVLVAGGVVFRLTLLPLAPATSQDVQRYLWEGLVQLEGFNPYALPPTAEQLAPLAKQHLEIWRLINHADIPAVYPPTAQFLFWCNAAVFGGSLLGWKLILLVLDGLLAVGVMMLLKERSHALVGLAGVLWCPLLLIETYEGGHLDVIGAALTVLAIVAMIRGRPILSALALGLSINVKYLWPLLLMIILARQAGRWRRCVVFVAVTLAVAVASWIPYRAGFESAAATARMFAEHWTFNDVIFELLRLIPGPRWLPMALVTAILVGLAGLLAVRQRRDIWRDAWLLTGAALLLGPVAYPWYFIWIMPGLAFRPPIWLAIWVLSVPALHLVDWHYVSTGQWDAMPRLWYAVGVVPAVLLVRAWWRRVAQGHKGVSHA
jgi:alpha-1,6-mannosyltransferase